MATGNANQSWKFSLMLSVLLITAVSILWFSDSPLFRPMGTDPRHPWIRLSAFFVLLVWPYGAMLPFASRIRPLDRPSIDAIGTRLNHTVACILCLLHIAIAFHHGHGWSHQAAFEHTERVSGFGDGIFVNYLFVLVWIADVIWAWVSLDHYLKRPAWLNWLVIGFMGFVIFNAAVVFGSGVLRWASLIVLIIPWSLLWWASRWRRRQHGE